MNYSIQQGKDAFINKIAFFAFVLLVMDCTISSGGHWLMFGPLSLRMVLGLISISLSIPPLVKKIKILAINPMLISLVLFVLYLLISAIVGYNKGNRNDVIISDLRGFSWLFIVPIAIVLIDCEEKLIFIMKSIITASVIHSLIILCFNISLVFFNTSYSNLQGHIQKIQFGAIGVVGDGIYRFTFGSTLSNIASCVFMVFFQMKRKTINWFIVVFTALCYFILLISYTRSTYLATFLTFFITFLGYVLIFPENKKLLLKFHILALMVTISFVFIFQVTAGNNYLKFGLQRTFLNISLEKKQNISPTSTPTPTEHYLLITEKSDALRNNTKADLIEMIEENFFWGNGLGASILSRPEGLVEYIYHDLLNKVGLVGLFLYLFPVIYMILQLVRPFKWIIKHWKLKFVWLSGLMGFLVATYFNPYMNSSLGICFYGLSIATFSIKFQDS